MGSLLQPQANQVGSCIPPAEGEHEQMIWDVFQELVRNFGPPTKHQDLPDSERKRYEGDKGYKPEEWEAFLMGKSNTKTQIQSVFYGTSVSSAIDIHRNGFYVDPTSVHFGNTGLFGYGNLSEALVDAKRHPPHVKEEMSLSLKCPVVIEYRCDPGVDDVDPNSKVPMGKKLQPLSKTSKMQNDRFVWKQPPKMKIMGFGDGGFGHMADPHDPIGISVVFLHVNTEILKNYVRGPRQS